MMILNRAMAIAVLLVSLADTASALFGGCSKRGCSGYNEQLYKRYPDGSCQNLCVLFPFSLQRQGWQCGTCGDATKVELSPNEFNARMDLADVAEQFHWAFARAAAKWQTVIKGDISDYDTRYTIQGYSSCVRVPKIVDDTYICATVGPIDGRGGVLGRAGTEYVRDGDNLPITGQMHFDSADVQTLIDRGTFDKVILHEMGHILGISGSSWRRNGMTRNCRYKANSKASREWQKLTGCPAHVPIPVETEGGGGTACSHWDERCFLGEVMSGFASGGMELSNMTVAALEDLGYSVNYSAADVFSVEQLNPYCVSELCGTDGNRRLDRPTWLDGVSAVGENKNVDKGAELARQYGKITLEELTSKRPKNKTPSSSLRASSTTTSSKSTTMGKQSANGAVYVADEFVSVIYEDDSGEVHSLAISKVDA